MIGGRLSIRDAVCGMRADCPDIHNHKHISNYQLCTFNSKPTMKERGCQSRHAGGQGRSKDERDAELDALSKAARKWYDFSSVRGSTMEDVHMF